MTLKREERSEIVAYRLEKALKTLKEVMDVGAMGYWNLAANRLYYAAYYASAALLISEKIDASTHKGISRMIGSVFVRKGLLRADEAKLFSKLFTMRQSGDYEDLFDWEEKHVRPLIPEVEKYIHHISELIEVKYDPD